MSIPAPPACPQTLSGLLLSLTSSRSLPKGQQLHAHLLKSGCISISPLLSNNLVALYSRCRHPQLSHRAFLDSPAKSPSSWSSLISAFSHNDLPHLSLLSFRSMLRSSVPPSDRTLPVASRSAASLSLPSLGRSLHALSLKTLLDSDVFVASSLLDMYAKCSLLPSAHHLFLLMPLRNAVSWTALICGYANHANSSATSIRLFRSALADSSVNDFTYSCVLRVCAASTLLDLGQTLHSLSLRSGFLSSPFVGSSLISLYSKCGLLPSAYSVFRSMPHRNLGAWNAVLIASAQHGRTADAVDAFRTMLRESVHRPNFITFLCLLTACSHAGMVEQGRKYFAMMSEEYGIAPMEQHYAALVDLLSRAGRLKEAVGVIEAMPMPPTESVWGALLTGCRIHKDTETAAFAAEKLFETGSRSSGAHMLLANAYAAAGRFADAAEARKAMRDRGVKKETGMSWVEEAGGGGIHTFVSGDRSHPRSEEIYGKLEEVGERMEEAGYIADTSFVLRDVDGEEKRRSVFYHSERLAIGFGLLTVPAGRPIRVMKNLRVCGDCHNAIKYVSKVTGRVVILRDNNRFHRFEDGVCSCGDYW